MKARPRCNMVLVDGSETITPIQGGVRSIQVCAHDCQHGHCARMTHTNQRLISVCILRGISVSCMSNDMDSPQARGSKKRGAVAPVDFAPFFFDCDGRNMEEIGGCTQGWENFEERGRLSAILWVFQWRNFSRGIGDAWHPSKTQVGRSKIIPKPHLSH